MECAEHQRSYSTATDSLESAQLSKSLLILDLTRCVSPEASKALKTRESLICLRASAVRRTWPSELHRSRAMSPKFGRYNTIARTTSTYLGRHRRSNTATYKYWNAWARRARESAALTGVPGISQPGRMGTGLSSPDTAQRYGAKTPKGVNSKIRRHTKHRQLSAEDIPNYTHRGREQYGK
jgi:hypothetical protein